MNYEKTIMTEFLNGERTNLEPQLGFRKKHRPPRKWRIAFFMLVLTATYIWWPKLLATWKLVWTNLT